MPDGRHRTPQMTTRIDPELRRKAVQIAELRGERDIHGKGLSVVIRDAVAKYVRKHEGLLDDHDDAPSPDA